MIDFKYLTICLFALRVGKKNEDWKIVYGCIAPTLDKMDSPMVSESNQIGTCEHGRLSIRKIVWSGLSENVLGIYNDLIRGISLKTAFYNHNIEVTNLNFDAVYTQEKRELPWGFETIADHQKAYTKKAIMFNPMQLFDKNGKVASDAEKARNMVEAYLDKQIGLPFNECFDRIGNLEIIIVSERDETGRPLVVLNWIKEPPFSQNIKVYKELLQLGDEIFINIQFVENERIVYEVIDNMKVTDIVDIDKSYKIKECPDVVIVKIWRKRDGGTCVLTDSVNYLLKQINVTIGVSEPKMVVTTNWLKDIVNNIPAKKEKHIVEAKTIERTHKEQFSIGNKEHRCSIKRKRIKENDEFFPKGWDSITEEHGMLSFLAWFKNKAKGTQQIFLQDPYFEDVAMYFFASAEINCEYIVLTQTKLKTNPDGRNNFVNEGESGQRKLKLLNCIRANPLMFDSMKLNVYDISSKHNVLHDRYLIFFYGNGTEEAYALSNSFQGATNKQPLLVTQIGDSALEKIKAHIKEGFNTKEIENIYNYANNTKIKRTDEEINKVADGGFLKWLDIQKENMQKGKVSPILEDIISWKTNNKLATLGYFLASIPDDESQLIFDHIKNEIKKNNDWITILKNFILERHYSRYPIGYIDCPYRAHTYIDLPSLLACNYKEIVNLSFQFFLDSVESERFTFGVYGQYYAAKLLLELSIKEYIDILKQLKPTLLGIKIDKTTTPCYKVTAMLIAELLKADMWSKTDVAKSVLMVDSDETFRGIGGILFLQKTKENDFKCGDFLKLVNNYSELIALCHIVCSIQNSPINKHIFYMRLVEIFQESKDVEYFKQLLINDILLSQTHNVTETANYIKNVVIPLIETKVLDKDDLSTTIINELYKKCVYENKARVIGILSEYLNLINCDLELLCVLAKEEKEKFENSIKTMTVKIEDRIFEKGKKMIMLRLLLMRLISNDEKKANKVIDDINRILEEINILLDNYGLGEIKKQYETIAGF